MLNLRYRLLPRADKVSSADAASCEPSPQNHGLDGDCATRAKGNCRCQEKVPHAQPAILNQRAVQNPHCKLVRGNDCWFKKAPEIKQTKQPKSLSESQ